MEPKKLLPCFPRNPRSSLENRKTATMWCSEKSWGNIWEYKFSQKVDFCLFYGNLSLSAPHMLLWAPPPHTHNFFILDHKISFPFSLCLCHRIFIFRMATLWPWWRRERWSHCSSCGRENGWHCLSLSGRKAEIVCWLNQATRRLKRPEHTEALTNHWAGVPLLASWLWSCSEPSTWKSPPLV